MWLDRSANLPKDNLVIDTGSGLSYRTQIRPLDLVSIVRSAGGFGAETTSDLSKAWLHSLAVGGTDGTLKHRFRSADMRGHIVGKTGSLRNVIALSGILDVDPTRPLAFSIVTNTEKPLQKRQIRAAHAQVIAEVCKYLAKTSHAIAPVPPPAPVPAPSESEGVEETEPDPEALDAETASHE